MPTAKDIMPYKAANAVVETMRALAQKDESRIVEQKLSFGMVQCAAFPPNPNTRRVRWNYEFRVYGQTWEHEGALISANSIIRRLRFGSDMIGAKAKRASK